MPSPMPSVARLWRRVAFDSEGNQRFRVISDDLSHDPEARRAAVPGGRLKVNSSESSLYEQTLAVPLVGSPGGNSFLMSRIECSRSNSGDRIRIGIAVKDGETVCRRST